MQIILGEKNNMKDNIFDEVFDNTMGEVIDNFLFLYMSNSLLRMIFYLIKPMKKL